MAISNQPDNIVLAGCLFSPTLEIPQEFPTWCVPACRVPGRDILTGQAGLQS